MIVTLLTAASESHWPIMELSLPNKAEYCAKHKIQLDARKHVNIEYIHGERQLFSLDALDHCDWLFFNGADTLIMNQQVDVRVFIDPYYDLIIGLDVNGINNDVLLLKNCQKSRTFLECVLAMKNLCPNDQVAMAHTIQNLPGFKTKAVHQRLFNSYLYKEYPYHKTDNGGTFELGDFMLHLPGLPVERRLELMNEYLPKVIR